MLPCRRLPVILLILSSFSRIGGATEMAPSEPGTRGTY